MFQNPVWFHLKWIETLLIIPQVLKLIPYLSTIFCWSREFNLGTEVRSRLVRSSSRIMIHLACVSISIWNMRVVNIVCNPPAASAPAPTDLWGMIWRAPSPPWSTGTAVLATALTNYHLKYQLQFVIQYTYTRINNLFQKNLNCNFLINFRNMLKLNFSLLEHLWH